MKTRLEKAPRHSLEGNDSAQWHILKAKGLRDEVIAVWGFWTAEQIVAHAKDSNPTSVATWSKARRIFAVRHEGRDVFPKFQFDRRTGQPLQVIADVLAKFPLDANGWRVALWLTGPNGYLGGALPVDLLLRRPKQVLDAAEAEFVHPGT